MKNRVWLWLPVLAVIAVIATVVIIKWVRTPVPPTEGMAPVEESSEAEPEPEIEPESSSEEESLVEESSTEETEVESSKEEELEIIIPEEEPPAGPEIQLSSESVRVEAGRPYDLYSNILSVKDADGTALSKDDFLKRGTYVLETKADLYNAGTYTAKVKARDANGIEAEATFTVEVYYYSEPEEGQDQTYLIRVNRMMNTVTVYTQDENGEFTVPYRVMVCSSGGLKTPLGTFSISDTYEWRPLLNRVYGRYASRITGKILFHSVPYYSKNPADVESEEFNKLGEDASLGCIRLRLCDVKWIYDNCPRGTKVEIYDSEDPGPLGKPVSVQIDLESENRGWDPTDPEIP